MSKFYIESKAGVIMGIYEGASKEDAVAALDADVGGESTIGDWIVLEVVGVDQDLEHGATLYTLRNGGVLVEMTCPRRDYYYSDMSAAREALSD